MTNDPIEDAAEALAVEKTAEERAAAPEENPDRAEGKLVKQARREEKRRRKEERKGQWVAARNMASSFPMVELIAEQVRTGVPQDLVERVEESAGEKRKIISPTYPYPKRMKYSDYCAEKKLLEVELVKMQAWVKETGARIVLLFEGRDAAGKGGTIRRFTENLNPRGARVVALDKPSEHEQGDNYLRRYVPHLPRAGEIVMFDRSWYNRAGVERVMGFCTPEEYLEFMRQAPEFERMLVNSGLHLTKFWFSVTRSEQRTRFVIRQVDPVKQWKLSPMDLESRRRWE